MVTKEQVLECLQTIKSPNSESDIVSQGLVSDIFFSDDSVVFSITVPAEKAENLEPLRKAAEARVLELSGVNKAMVALTAERKPGQGGAPNPVPSNKNAEPSKQSTNERPPAKPDVVGVKNIIAVASGKGGVGKSTTACNIALGLQTLGLKIGILDADIYGPSMPRLLGISGRPTIVSGRTLKPMEGYGLKVMSMGFLVDEETPMIWRGPMVISALTQMLREVAWEDLDVLVVDMPPGTGDAQLTMAQQVPLAGSVIVSTPQDLALLDARKGLNMFRKVNVPVLGIVENMSYFLCPSCGERSDIFGSGGARREAERLGVPFLGEVPLHMSIRENSDAGKPVIAVDPAGPHAKSYCSIAKNIWQEIEVAKSNVQSSSPKIVIE